MEARETSRAVFLMALLLVMQPRDLPPSPPVEPFHFIRAIDVDPRRSETVYVATENQGLIKSADGGAHWKLINKGIRNYLVYDVKTSLKTPGRVYAATWGGGFYLSNDGGESWEEQNAELGNTAVGSIVLNTDGKAGKERIYIGTSTDLFEFSEGETAWNPLGDGLAFWNGPQFQSLALIDSDPPLLFMGSEEGLYKKTVGASGWTAVGAMKGKRITALLYHPRSGALYAGTLGSGGILVSRDRGKSWSRSGSGLEKSWIRSLAAHPSDPTTIYAASGGEGVLKSRDGGAHWAKVNSGLSDLDVRSLVVDSKNPSILFAGTHGAGIFKSTDGGTTWKLQTGLPFEGITRQLDAIDAGSDSKNSNLLPPLSFQKCNRCHGWTEAGLNQKATYWRVAATRRSWKQTVSRMSEGTDISPKEQEEIAKFLQKYTGKASEEKPPP